MLVVVVIAAIPAALFTVQNANWVAQLSLDLQFSAWILKEPMPVPYLMWMSFGVGILGGMVAIPLLKALLGGSSSDHMDDYGGSSI